MRPIDRAIDEVTRQWVLGHESAMRRAAAEAIAASNRWRQINGAIMIKATAEGWDELRIAQDKAASLVLTDAYGTYSFFAGKAQMHADVLQGALAARVLLSAGQPAEPAASWPAAADRDVPRPARRPRPYHPADDAGVVLGGLVDPPPLTDPALRDTNSPTGPAHDNPVAGHPHSVSGPVGGKRSTAPGVDVVDQGAAGAGAPAAPIPTHAGPGNCPECGAGPGDKHELSCPEVSPEQFRAFLAGA